MTTVLAAPETSRAPAARILALDAARGFAVLGMITVHVGVLRDLSWGDPGSWIGIAAGRSSILFATLAGVSIALLSGRERPPSGEALVAVRLRILVRALVLFAVGGVLTMLGSGVSVILQTYALLFACCLPFLRWSPRRLFGLAAGWAVVAPPLTLWLAQWVPSSCAAGENCSGAQITDLAVTGDYPGLVWITFALTGLALGRCDLGARVTRLRMLAVGVASMLLGYGGAWLIGYLNGPAETTWSQLRTAEPHSGTTFEIAGSLGFALTVMATLLLAAEHLRPLLFPIVAVGTLPLTVYSAHVIAIQLLGDSVTDATGNLLLAVFLSITVAASVVWVLVMGRGPLERLMTWLCVRATAARGTEVAAGPGSAPAL
ncbi:heparan-alpha-glucosaminide N-acetyltransferase domain-containing protein [Nocardia sp. CDC160]|uniref:heparan-alpha-glucosaminide N-acetyltransferase domain-containing protein n=1 Tax=Nocardia sp. CDC160 TaxID=3112166 RepID=UPI002DB93350|nr:heparan-alpha-glucosaminide N-acetyltransferase domain-containing protein [Nocardia sp. CDC160]MEC3915137.1 heparan-alpha-glucosaminide N-acetyltransferase domain-containing protein [Nocardia sp. CDC160]